MTFINCRNQNRWTHCYVLLGMLAWLSAGCSTVGSQSHQIDDDDAGLYAWVDEELAPYLVNQLSQQPRFKKESVLLVAMQDTDIRTDIDALTLELRARLMDKLLLAPGADMIWHPSAKPYEHHRHQSRLECNTASSARYFVGLDLATTADGKVQLRVRALDVSAGTWVAGFGQRFTGRLTRNQLRAANTNITDEYLRGLRVLPFKANEIDLLAAYVAQNIQCVLRDIGAPRARVAIDSAIEAKPELHKILALVSHNLAQERVAKYNRDTVEELITLAGSLIQIDGGLHQLWVQLSSKSTIASGTSVDTAAYLNLVQPVESDTNVRPAMAPERSTLPAAESMGVMSPLRLLTTYQSDGCPENSSNKRARRRFSLDEECYAIEFDLFEPAHLLVFRHTEGGGFSRLPQVGCGIEKHSRHWQTPGRNRRIVGLHVDLHGRDRTETVYAMAVSDGRMARDLALHFEQLPDGCIPDRYLNGDTDFDFDWLAMLDSIVERYPKSVEWQSITIQQASY